ncbi:11917_t:CDS:2 [Gigaspora rosea]|nr:11917_t:CDS:2 [Gigaspora rosea]
MDVELMNMESAELVLTKVESAELEVELLEVDEKTKIRLAIEELDRMLKKDNNQMDKGIRGREIIKHDVLITSLIDNERIFMKELEPVLIEYDKDLTKLVEKNIPSKKKRHCVITHDETTLVANSNEKTG